MQPITKDAHSIRLIPLTGGKMPGSNLRFFTRDSLRLLHIGAMVV
jgi:hypothetical protein